MCFFGKIGYSSIQLTCCISFWISLFVTQFSVSFVSFSRSALSLSIDSCLREFIPTILSDDWLVTLSACEDNDLFGLPSFGLPYGSLLGAYESHMIPVDSVCFSFPIPSNYCSLWPISFRKKEED